MNLEALQAENAALKSQLQASVEAGEKLAVHREQIMAANDRLARIVVAGSERLEESRRELLATGWDAAMARGGELAAWAIGNRPEAERPDTANPYRKPIVDFGAGDDQ